MKSEKETIFEKSLILSYSYKIIIVLDGHGLSDLKNIILKNNCYFLTEEKTSISSEKFNEELEKLCYSAGDYTKSLIKTSYTTQHYLYPLKGSQKFTSKTIQKILKENPVEGYKGVSSLVNNFEIDLKQCTLKFLYTDFNTITKCRLVQMRIEGTEDKSITLSEIEEFVVPWFTKQTGDNQIENLIWESCGCTNDLSEKIPVEYFWGACRDS